MMPRDSAISEQQLNIKFVQEVEKRPCLYNFELLSYTRKDITDQAWEEVGQATNMPASACRERWRNIRGVFMRTVKAPLEGKGYKKPYYLADVMEFIRPFMKPLTRTVVQQQPPPSLASKDKDMNSLEIEAPPVKIEIDDEEDDHTKNCEEEERERRGSKRSCQDSEEIVLNKRTSLTQSPVIQSYRSLTNTSDHVRSFVNSLMPELNEMDSTQFKSFKRRVLLLIDDIMANASTPKPSEDEYII